MKKVVELSYPLEIHSEYNDELEYIILDNEKCEVCRCLDYDVATLIVECLDLKKTLAIVLSERNE